MSFEISNYDVLLTRDINGNCTLLESDHVGNRRFTVLLDIHRERYNLALQGNDTTECERIVDIIINTVCTECVPNGRFLEQVVPNVGQEGVVRQFFPPEIKTTLHIFLGGATGEPQQPQLPPMPNTSAFQNAAVFAEISCRRDLLQRSISESMINFPPPLNRNNFHRSLSAQSDTYIPAHTNLHMIIPNLVASHPSFPTRVEISPTQQSFPMVDLRSFAQQTASVWASASNIMNNNHIPPPAPSLLPPFPETCMDVVFGRDYESISASPHVGNNRFRVLVNLQCNAFHEAVGDIQQKERILHDIIESVESWNGRFLVETPYQYQFMTLMQAKECIRAILMKQSLRLKEIDVLKSRKEKKESMRRLMKQCSDSNFNYTCSGDDSTAK